MLASRTRKPKPDRAVLSRIAFESNGNRRKAPGLANVGSGRDGDRLRPGSQPVVDSLDQIDIGGNLSGHGERSLGEGFAQLGQAVLQGLKQSSRLASGQFGP